VRVVSATIDLRGAACRSHFAECALRVNGGTVVIFGHNFGDGSIDVGETPVDLGIVRPSATWQVEGD
jgi:hypothetical protein